MSKRLDGTSMFTGITSGLTNAFTQLSNQYEDGVTLENLNKASAFRECKKLLRILWAESNMIPRNKNPAAYGTVFLPFNCRKTFFEIMSKGGKCFDKTK